MAVEFVNQPLCIREDMALNVDMEVLGDNAKSYFILFYLFGKQKKILGLRFLS